VKYLLDTDCCVYLLVNAIPVLTERVDRCEEGTLAFPAISFAELAYGSQNDKLPPNEIVNAFAEEIRFLEFGVLAARAYAKLPFRRGSFDRLIAAHALSLDLVVLTRNVYDFADIPGVVVEDWTRG